MSVLKSPPMSDCHSSSLDWTLRVRGALATVLAIFLVLRMMGPPLSGFSVGLGVSFLLWAGAEWKGRSSALLPLYGAGLAAGLLHGAEEYAYGFQREMPALFGVSWADGQWEAFNLVWLGVFLLAGAGVYVGNPLAYLVVIFFGLLGGVFNGIAHLGLSIAQRSYFPGTFTAPLMLIMGILILRSLFRDEGRRPVS